MIKINIKGVVEAIYSNMELQGTNGLVVWRNNCVEVLTESAELIYDLKRLFYRLFKPEDK